MGEALIEHAEHDIHRDQRAEDQQRLPAAGLGEIAGIAVEAAADALGHVQIVDRALDIWPWRPASGTSGSRLNDTVDDGNDCE